MRLPRSLLPHRITVTPLVGTTARGAVVGEPSAPFAAFVERSDNLRAVDMRPDSATKGQEIVVTARIVVQVERHQVPGTFVDFEGERLQVVQSWKRSHSAATPNHSELRAV